VCSLNWGWRVDAQVGVEAEEMYEAPKGPQQGRQGVGKRRFGSTSSGKGKPGVAVVRSNSSSSPARQAGPVVTSTGVAVARSNSKSPVKQAGPVVRSNSTSLSKGQQSGPVLARSISGPDGKKKNGPKAA
jgi:hypothetical protein